MDYEQPMKRYFENNCEIENTKINNKELKVVYKDKSTEIVKDFKSLVQNLKEEFIQNIENRETKSLKVYEGYSGILYMHIQCYIKSENDFWKEVHLNRIKSYTKFLHKQMKNIKNDSQTFLTGINGIKLY